jgi:hypothetical protein
MNIKLQDALLDIAREVEKIETPSVPELETSFDEVLQAIDSGDLGKQSKAVRKHIACLVKWQVEKV